MSQDAKVSSCDQCMFFNKVCLIPKRCISITICGVVETNEKIRILNVNELASKNDVLTNLQSAGLTVNNVTHEECSFDVPLFCNKNNGIMIAWVKKIDNMDPIRHIKIKGGSVPVVWCDRRFGFCFRCGKFGHKTFMCMEVLEANLGAQKLNLQHEGSSYMQRKDKMDVTLLDSNEITDETNPDSSCVSSRNEVGDQM